MSSARRTQLMEKIPTGQMRELVRVGPAYPLVGPNQATIRQAIDAPAGRVFGWLEDAAAWNEFLGIEVEWTTPDPKGAGTTRTVTVNNQIIEETFLVWEAGRRMVFRFDRCTLPVRAFGESWALEPTGDGSCELAWSSAFDWAGRGGAVAARGFRAAFSAGGRRALAKLRRLVESNPDRFGGGIA